MLQNHKVPAQGNPRIVHRSMEGSVSQKVFWLVHWAQRQKKVFLHSVPPNGGQGSGEEQYAARLAWRCRASDRPNLVKLSYWG